MYIYVDILIITSIYANFFLLKTTARLIHSPLKNGKCVLAAVVGSLFSLIILLPRLNTLLLLIIRILSAAVMIITAFSGMSPKELYRTGLIFFFVSFIFAGIEYGISILSGGQNMVWHNSVLYVNISLLTLIVSTIISYAAISFFRYFIDGGNFSDTKYHVTVTRNGRTASFTAIGDTGNDLTDVFTGRPVIVCGKNKLSGIFEPQELEDVLSAEKSISGWRLIPFSTISSGGMLPVFKPSAVIIKDTENSVRRTADVYIGIVDREMEYAVLNPKLL